MHVCRWTAGLALKAGLPAIRRERRKTNPRPTFTRVGGWSAGSGSAKTNRNARPRVQLVPRAGSIPLAHRHVARRPGDRVDGRPTMDRVLLLEHLAQAERHISQGELRLAKLELLISELERDGKDATRSRDLVKTVRETQALHFEHRDRILGELERCAMKPASGLLSSVTARSKSSAKGSPVAARQQGRSGKIAEPVIMAQPGEGLLSAGQCRAFASEFKRQSRAPNSSEDLAFIRKNIARTLMGLAPQLEILAAKQSEETERAD